MPDERPETADAEDVLTSALRPEERALWISQPDRAIWLRALVWGLGCLPFTMFLLALLAVTLVLGAVAAQYTLGQGKLPLDVALPATIGGLLLVIFLYPLLVSELQRRERRYVITTQRALILDSKRVEHEVDLARVRLVALHKGLFDDSPTGVELRVADGTAAVIFKDVADPPAMQTAVEGALKTARDH